MNRLYTKVWFLTLAISTLPLLDVELDQIGKWLKGDQFRTFLAQQIVTPVLSFASSAVVSLWVRALLGI